jgi:hypothetical protein
MGHCPVFRSAAGASGDLLLIADVPPNLRMLNIVIAGVDSPARL